MNKCLICGKNCEKGFHHPKCSLGLFGDNSAPTLEYTWDDLNTLAEKVIRERITVPGVQPKISLHIERNGNTSSGRFTIVGFKGGFILKPPTKRFPTMPEAEHFCMTLARLCKMETVEYGLIKLKSGEKAYITKRMDRPPEGKLHMEDFCQLTNKLTELKYKSSMEQVGKALRRFSSVSGLDVIRFFEISVFSFLTGNSDMHLKNFSLLHLPNGARRLAPFYDLLPVRILLPEDDEEMALPLNGKKNKLSRNDFQILGKSLRMTEKQTENALNRVVSNVSANLPAALESSFLPLEFQENANDLILSRIARIAN
jgi:serine/threonine-protein kinase HipA